MAMQRLGDVVLEVLEELAIDARELALAGEFARERKVAGRDWVAINGQLVATSRGREDNPCQSPTREGGPRLVLVKG